MPAFLSSPPLVPHSLSCRRCLRRCLGGRDVAAAPVHQGSPHTLLQLAATRRRSCVGIAGGLHRSRSSPLPKEMEPHGAYEAGLELPLPEETEPRRANGGRHRSDPAACRRVPSICDGVGIDYDARSSRYGDMDGTDYACDGIKKQRDQSPLNRR